MDRAARFIGLQMSDEMPARALVSQLRDLLFGFLHAVLTEVGGAEFDETSYPTRRMRLADRDEPDIFRTTTAVPRSRFDARFHRRESRGKPCRRVNICHH